MSYTLTVTNPVNHLVWEKTLAEGEVDSVKKEIEEGGIKPVDAFFTQLYPARTDTLCNFAKDLFLPATFNMMERSHNIALIILTFISDAITLIARLITCIPRTIYNSQQKPIPFYKYLTDNRVNPKIFEGNRVIVDILLTREETSPNHTSIQKMTETFSVNFIALPKAIAPISYTWSDYGSTTGLRSSSEVGTRHAPQ